MALHARFPWSTMRSHASPEPGPNAASNASLEAPRAAFGRARLEPSGKRYTRTGSTGRRSTTSSSSPAAPVLRPPVFTNRSRRTAGRVKVPGYAQVSEPPGEGLRSIRVTSFAPLAMRAAAASPATPAPMTMILAMTRQRTCCRAAVVRRPSVPVLRERLEHRVLPELPVHRRVAVHRAVPAHRALAE